MLNLKSSLLIAAAATFVLPGCAQKASMIVGEKVSTYRYEEYTCTQLQKETERLSTNIGILSAQQDQMATHDQWAGPLLAHGNGSGVTRKLAQYKGELEAVEIAGIRKDCPVKLSLGY